MHINDVFFIQQQIHAQQLQSAHTHGPPLPMMPHPAALAGLPPPSAAAAAAAISAAGMPPSSSAAGLLALSAGAINANSSPHLPGVPSGSTLSKESSHRDRENNDREKHTPNGKLMIQLSIMKHHY